jgi:hypothetical protein
MVSPPPLPSLDETAPMNQSDAITAWLLDVELYRIQAGRFARLQGWGREQCGWLAPG